ncbi:MAG: SDR family oxidoreductase [Chloroflexota bacterium]
MKVVIFGATGRTGKYLIDQALAQGHSVTAFARTPSKLTITHERLHVIQGDVLDAFAVEQAVKGQDAVLSVLGLKQGGSTTILIEGTQQIIKAMKNCGVERIICVVTAGFLGERPTSIIGKLLVWFYRISAKQYMEPSRLQSQALGQSGLKWTAIRAILLNDGPPKGNYRIATENIPKGGYQINTGDMAEFMLRQISSDEYIGQIPAIAY